MPERITIYTSANNGEEILILPIVPTNLPEMVTEFKHEEFITNEKALTLIGRAGRRKLSLELLLPCNKNYKSIHPQAKADGREYITFWEKWSERRVPMRLIITEGVKEILNIAYTIDSLSWQYDRKKDIKAKLEISEYIFTTEPEEEKAPEYKWDEIYIRHNGSGFKVKASNVGGHWLVPFRRVLELMGYVVSWNGNTKAIYYSKDGKSDMVKSAWQIYEGTAYGYVYMICNELGYEAQWDGETRTVEIR